MSDLSWLGTPPYATLIILGASLLLSFLITLLNSRLTSKEKREQLKKWQKEIKEWTSEFRKAHRTGDKNLLKKVQKQEKRIKQIQAKMAKQSFSQLKMMPITIVLFLLFWLALTGTLTIPFTSLHFDFFSAYAPINASKVVAFLPWLGETPIELYLIHWYLICSLAAGVLFSRLFGLGMGSIE